jgi:hypothetical protein
MSEDNYVINISDDDGRQTIIDNILQINIHLISAIVVFYMFYILYLIAIGILYYVNYIHTISYVK